MFLRPVRRKECEWDVQDEHDSGFSAGLILSPVFSLVSCVLDTVSYRDGNRRQLSDVRMSTDINVVLSRCSVKEFEGSMTMGEPVKSG